MVSRTDARAQIAEIEASVAMDLAELQRHNRALDEYVKALEAHGRASAVYLQALDSMRRALVVSLTEWAEVTRRRAASEVLVSQIRQSKMGAEGAVDKIQQRLKVAQQRLRGLRAIAEAQAVVFDLVAARAATSSRDGARLRRTPRAGLQPASDTGQAPQRGLHAPDRPGPDVDGG